MLGEHTEETLTELLGLSTDEVEALEDEGVVSFVHYVSANNVV